MASPCGTAFAARSICTKNLFTASLGRERGVVVKNGLFQDPPSG
jgi:hypothetical protein